MAITDYCKTLRWGLSSRLEAAYEQTLRTTGLKDRGDPIIEMIAKKIIEIAQTGVRDPAQISMRAIKESASREVASVCGLSLSFMSLD
jgi:hypothetical protein